MRGLIQELIAEDARTEIDGVRCPEIGDTFTDGSGHSYKISASRKSNSVSNVTHTEYECTCLSGPIHVGAVVWLKKKHIQEYLL